MKRALILAVLIVAVMAAGVVQAEEPSTIQTEVTTPEVSLTHMAGSPVAFMEQAASASECHQAPLVCVAKGTRQQEFILMSRFADCEKCFSRCDYAWVECTSVQCANDACAHVCDWQYSNCLADCNYTYGCL